MVGKTEKRNGEEYEGSGETRNKGGSSDREGLSDVENTYEISSEKDKGGDDSTNKQNVSNTTVQADNQESQGQGVYDSGITSEEGGSARKSSGGIEKILSPGLYLPQQQAQSGGGFDTGIRTGTQQNSGGNPQQYNPSPVVTSSVWSQNRVGGTVGRMDNLSVEDIVIAIRKMPTLYRIRIFKEIVPYLNKEDILQLFRQLSIEDRVQEANRTLQEANALVNKIRSAVANATRLFPEENKKKPFDRFVDRIMDSVDIYLKNSLGSGNVDRDKLREAIREALEGSGSDNS